MKKTYSLILLLVLPFTVITAQNTDLTLRWSENTSYTMPARSWETGLFQAFRYGLSDRIEIRTNALLLPVLPNAGVKIAYNSDNDLSIASEHSISYPTLFLKTFQLKGTGGLISQQYTIPTIISINNSILLSKPLGDKSLLSGDAGLGFVIRGGPIDYRASIDEPFIYQRMAHYYKGVQLCAGFSFKTQLTNHLFCEESVKFYGIIRKSDNLFFENHGVLMMSSKGAFRIKGGYQLSWGTYPFGNHWQMWPVIDILFGRFKK